jgi:hypothetical protein
MRSAVFKTIEPEIRSMDESTRTIWHPVTREVKDRMGDIIEIDGLSLKNFKRKPSVLYGHDYVGKDPVPVVAENVGFRHEGDTLLAGTRFLDSSRVSAKLGNLINDLWYLNTKKLVGWSVGFVPNMDKAENISDASGRVTGRRFKEAELLEYSNVIIPAHQDAVNAGIAKGILSEGSGPSFIGGVLFDVGEGKIYYCRELTEPGSVAKEKIDAAVDMVKYAGWKMRLKGPVELRWFRLAEPDEPGAKILGPKPTRAFVLTGGEPQVWIRGGLSVGEVQFVTAHELHHVWFERQGWGDNPEKEAIREGAADAFAFIVTHEVRSGQRYRDPDAFREVKK